MNLKLHVSTLKMVSLVESESSNQVIMIYHMMKWVKVSELMAWYGKNDVKKDGSSDGERSDKLRVVLDFFSMISIVYKFT